MNRTCGHPRECMTNLSDDREGDIYCLWCADIGFYQALIHDLKLESEAYKVGIREGYRKGYEDGYKEGEQFMEKLLLGTGPPYPRGTLNYRNTNQ